MKKYRLKRSVLQSMILFMLALFAHRENADDAMLLFAAIGIAMILHSNTHLIYRVARRIVHYGNMQEWYHKC